MKHFLSILLSLCSVCIVAGCSDDEPTPLPEPNPDTEPSLEQLEAEFWGDETPHWFYDKIDTLIIANLDSEGFLTHSVDYNLTNVWEWRNTPKPTAEIYLFGKSKIDPVTNEGRYVDICKQMGCRPRSGRVILPSVVDLPEFELRQTRLNYLVADTLINVDVIALNQFEDTIAAGDLLRDNVQVNTLLFQRVTEDVAKNGTDAKAPYSQLKRTFSSSAFNGYKGAVPGPWIILNFNYGKAPGIYTFKVRITLKNQKPLETEFKIKFEDNIPNP